MMEQKYFDPDSGQRLSGSFMDYAMPEAENFCDIEIDSHPVPTASNPLGAEGVGECGAVGALAATMNAVCNALQPLGIRHFEMPATPSRLWEAISAAKGRKAA